MDKLKKTLKALANKRRLQILAYLKNSKKASVGEITDKIKMSFRTVSKHLAILLAIGIVEREQMGAYGIYRLAQNQELAVRHILSLL